MSGTDIQIAICGSAGDGTIAAGSILNQAMARAGYKVIAFDVYPAEILAASANASHARASPRSRSSRRRRNRTSWSR